MDILDQLKMPFKTIHFRPKTCSGGKVMLLAYLDSRDVMKRLDDVFGLDWERDYKEIKGNVYCGITITIDGRKITKWDCGVESDNEGEKGESSDAFKRAAVNFGIGRYLYSLTNFWVPIHQNKNGNYISIKDKKTNQYVKGYYDTPQLPKWATEEGYKEIIKQRDEKKQKDKHEHT